MRPAIADSKRHPPPSAPKRRSAERRPGNAGLESPGRRFPQRASSMRIFLPSGLALCREPPDAARQMLRKSSRRLHMRCMSRCGVWMWQGDRAPKGQRRARTGREGLGLSSRKHGRIRKGPKRKRSLARRRLLPRGSPVVALELLPRSRIPQEPDEASVAVPVLHWESAEYFPPSTDELAASLCRS